jgi:hypothetical protein
MSLGIMTKGHGRGCILSSFEGVRRQEAGGRRQEGGDRREESALKCCPEG